MLEENESSDDTDWTKLVMEMYEVCVEHRDPTDAVVAAAAVAVAVAERHGATVDTNGYYVDADDDNVKTKKHVVVVVVVVAAAAEVEKVDNETWQYEDGREVSEVNGHVDDDWDLHLLPDGIVSQDRAELNRCPDRLFDLNC